MGPRIEDAAVVRQARSFFESSSLRGRLGKYNCYKVIKAEAIYTRKQFTTSINAVHVIVILSLIPALSFMFFLP